MALEVVSPDEVVADESTPGVVRTPVFETEKAVMVQSEIDDATTTGWHHHGDRRVYGYIVDGAGAVEYGLGGNQTREYHTGE